MGVRQYFEKLSQNVKQCELVFVSNWSQIIQINFFFILKDRYLMET